MDSHLIYRAHTPTLRTPHAHTRDAPCYYGLSTHARFTAVASICTTHPTRSFAVVSGWLLPVQLPRIQRLYHTSHGGLPYDAPHTRVHGGCAGFRTGRSYTSFTAACCPMFFCRYAYALVHTDVTLRNDMRHHTTARTARIYLTAFCCRLFCPFYTCWDGCCVHILHVLPRCIPHGDLAFRRTRIACPDDGSPHALRYCYLLGSRFAARYAATAHRSPLPYISHRVATSGGFYTRVTLYHADRIAALVLPHLCVHHCRVLRCGTHVPHRFLPHVLVRFTACLCYGCPIVAHTFAARLPLHYTLC